MIPRPDPESTPSVPHQRGVPPRRRLRTGIALILFAGLVVGGIGIALIWHGHHDRAHLAAALPPLPDLDDQPAELRQRMQQALKMARDPATTFEGIAEYGRLCQANGFFAEAEVCWRVLLNAQPENPRWGYYLAALRRTVGDPAGREDLLASTVERAPTYAPAWLQLADLHFKHGRLAEAESAYRQRLQLRSGDPYARLGLARIALQQDRREEARTLIEQLVADAPGFAPGHNLYAEMLAADGDAAGAARERTLGTESGRFREAEDPWLDELINWSYDYEQLCLRGTRDALTNHGDRGRSLFERAIQLRPDALTAYELLGNLYLDLHDAAKAREIYERGLQRAADATPSAKLYVNLSRASRELDQPAEAARVARQGLARVGEDYELYDALGLALGELGEHEAAVEALRTSVERHPGDAETNYHLALALIATRRLDEAVAALHRSLDAQPSFPLTLALLAQIEIDSGRWQNAMQYLQPLYASHPELPQAREKMIFCHLQAGLEAEKSHDVAAAEQHYRAGLAIEPDRAELQARLGALLLIEHRFADAVAPLEAYHRLQSEDPRGALFLGQAYAALGRRDAARQVLTTGLRLAEHARDAATAQHCRAILQHLP